ncbi:MAG: cation:dicarboxylate symporter family transporter, partial [Gammaproteobacteria bacterium]
MSSDDNNARSKRPSLFVQVLIGFVLGAVAGLFFGELAAPVNIIGQAYVGLLQMTVIPYIVVSLVGGLGRLSLDAAGRMAVHAGKALLMLWAIIIVTALLGPIAFPDWESAAFFSTGLLEAREEVDFLKLYIPSNPYNSLAAGIVPAIVVFSIALGIALISTKGKDGVLNILSTLSDAIMAISGFIVRLSPIGVLAITASAAGTLQFEEFEQLQIYTFISLAAWGLLLIVSLPLLVATVTPVRFSEVFKFFGSALLTAFATGNLLIVLPMLTESIKGLAAQYGIDSEESLGTVDVVVPSAYSLPSAGLFLSLAFVLFAGWFSGSQIGVESYPKLAVVGLFTAFGGTNLAVPFLLDMFRIPADLYQLYIVSDVVLGRFWTVFAAMFVIVLCVLMVFGLEDRLKSKRGGGLIFGIGTIALMVVAFNLLGSIFDRAISHDYSGYAELIGMELSREGVPTKDSDSAPTPLVTDTGESRLDLILER